MVLALLSAMFALMIVGCVLAIGGTAALWWPPPAEVSPLGDRLHDLRRLVKQAGLTREVKVDAAGRLAFRQRRRLARGSESPLPAEPILHAPAVAAVEDELAVEVDPTYELDKLIGQLPER